MNERIMQFAEQVYGSAATAQEIKFAELIVEHCASMCGSQADRKNLRNAFGLPVESDVKYPGPDAHWSVTSQYTRDYNIPGEK
jgi:hypothetical protein